MAEHKHGSMDITTQEKTFSAFITWSVRTAAAIIVILVLLALIGA